MSDTWLCECFRRFVLQEARYGKVKRVKMNGYIMMNMILKSSLSLFWVFFGLMSLNAQAVTTLEGSPASLDDYLNQDKWTVLKIWSHNCHACNATMHQINDFSAIAEDYNAQVLGLSIDGLDRLKEDQAFVEKHDLSFPNLVGDVMEVQQLVQTHAPNAPLATPTMMMFAPKGEFTGIVVGSGGITPEELIKYFEANQAEKATEAASQ